MTRLIPESIVHWLPENNRLERIWKLSKIDFKKRYYSSYLGIFWALLNPSFRLAIYYFVFTVILNSRTENFVLYIFLGFIFWLSFSEGTNKSFRLLKEKRYLIESIQFNKMDLYYSNIVSVLFGLSFNLMAYFIIGFFLHLPLTIHLLWLPLVVANLAILLFGMGLILSSISVFVRDLNMIWDLILLAGFWATPIFFDHNMLFEKASFLKYVNPIAPIVVNARDALLFGAPPDLYYLAYGMGYALVLVAIGFFFYNRMAIYAIEKF